MNRPGSALGTRWAGLALASSFALGGPALAGQELAGDEEGSAFLLVNAALDLFAGEDRENRPTGVFLHVFDDLPSSPVVDDWKRLASAPDNLPESRWMLTLNKVVTEGDRGTAMVAVYDFEAGGREGRICAPFWHLEFELRDDRWHVSVPFPENGWALTGIGEEGPYARWWRANGGS